MTAPSEPTAESMRATALNTAHRANDLAALSIVYALNAVSLAISEHAEYTNASWFHRHGRAGER